MAHSAPVPAGGALRAVLLLAALGLAGAGAFFTFQIRAQGDQALRDVEEAREAERTALDDMEEAVGQARRARDGEQRAQEDARRAEQRYVSDRRHLYLAQTALGWQAWRAGQVD